MEILSIDERALDSEERALWKELSSPPYLFNKELIPPEKAARFQWLQRRRRRQLTEIQTPRAWGGEKVVTGMENACPLNNTGETVLPDEFRALGRR